MPRKVGYACSDMLRRGWLLGTVGLAGCAVVVACGLVGARSAPASIRLPGVRRDEHGTRCYARVVDAAVSDPFRPPANPWEPGNRGLDFATTPGSLIHAAQAGDVTFAGAIAGEKYVTVLHLDGLRTSYSYLVDVAVVKGDQVISGQVLGVSGDLFHLGLRRGDEYLDPASILAAECQARRAILVPLDSEAG